MIAPLTLAFLPQRVANELEVEVSAGKRSVFKVYFRCRTGQTLRASADALFCLGLYPAAEIGAPLHIDGEVDRELCSRATTITGLFRSWWPACSNVDVKATLVDLSPDPEKRGIGLFFSGGVDSCFSLLAAQPRVSSLITLLGVDIPLSDRLATARLESVCQETCALKGLEPIVIETNVSQAFHPFAGWIEHHGSALAAIGHMLSGHLEGVMIASSGNEATWRVPWGSHPALDPMLGSRRLTVEHHGLVSRFDKIAHIATDITLMRTLRVCNRSRQNCGECDKCTFVMRSLQILGFDELEAFPPLYARRGRMEIIDDAFLTEFERLHHVAVEACQVDIVSEIDRTIAIYKLSRSLRKLGYDRWRRWFRVMRHRVRWLRVSL